MRYEGKRNSKQDDQHEVFTFSIDKEELQLMLAMVSSALKYTPRVVDTIPTRGRLQNFRKVLGSILSKQKVSS